MGDSSASRLESALAEVEFWRQFIAAERASLDPQALARCEAAATLAAKRLQCETAPESDAADAAPGIRKHDST